MVIRYEQGISTTLLNYRPFTAFIRPIFRRLHECSGWTSTGCSIFIEKSANLCHLFSASGRPILMAKIRWARTPKVTVPVRP